VIEKTKSTTLFLYRHHFVRYVFVGGSTFIIDFGLLYLLHQHANVSVPVAASISYWVSILYNFALNRYWTFSAWEKESLHKHLVAYGALLAFNYVFTIIVVSSLSHIMYFGLAKVIAVAIQIIWTYPIYKHIIFVKSGALASLKSRTKPSS
jgi:putative flippase GtrA